MPPIILLPLRVEIEVDLPTPSRAKDVLQNMGLSPPIPPPNGEWTAPHDHRRVAAELLVANHALEWMRVLLARGLLLAGTGGPADDGWLQWTADGRFELKRDWVSALLHPGSSGTPGQGLSPEQEDLVAIEVFRMGLSSPTTVVGGFWSNFWKWLERAAAVGELGHLGHLAFRQQAAAALFALGLGVPTPATPPPPPVRPEPIVLVAPPEFNLHFRQDPISLGVSSGDTGGWPGAPLDPDPHLAAARRPERARPPQGSAPRLRARRQRQ